jgi:hypothetical protein
MVNTQNHIMDNKGLIGLFFSDENNLIFKKIDHFKSLSDEKKIELEMLPFKFLGPVYMTDAENVAESWKIEFVESTLSLKQSGTSQADQLQSFFSLNSNLPSKNGEMTYLSAVISTPHTEDIKPLYEKMTEYIHPSIVQGQYYNKTLNKENFNRDKFINNELTRGINLLGYNLGSARKMYLDEHQKFYCVGLLANNIEEEEEEEEEESIFYTFDKDDSVCQAVCLEIPSYYIISTLPNYYEELIKEILNLFNIKGIKPNLRTINLSHQDKKVIYVEEYTLINSHKKSMGAILIPANEKYKEESKNISIFRKKLRTYLDKKKELKDSLKKFNSKLSSYQWSISSEEDLNNIKINLDKPL